MILVLLFSCLNVPSSDDTSAVEDDSHSAMELQVHELINEHRESIDLEPMELDADVSEVARGHSANMDDGSVPFSHDGADERAAEIMTFLPYRVFGENVAYNQGYPDPAFTAVQGWLGSPGHRENIEGDYDMTGIGVVGDEVRGYYFTQLFLNL